MQHPEGKILQIRVDSNIASNTVVLSSFDFSLPANSLVSSITANIHGRAQGTDSVIVYLAKIKAGGFDTLSKKGGETTGFAPTYTFTNINTGQGASLLSY